MKKDVFSFFKTVIHYVNRGFDNVEIIEYFEENEQFYGDLKGIISGVIISLNRFC